MKVNKIYVKLMTKHNFDEHFSVFKNYQIIKIWIDCHVRILLIQMSCSNNKNEEKFGDKTQLDILLLIWNSIFKQKSLHYKINMDRNNWKLLLVLVLNILVLS